MGQMLCFRRENHEYQMTDDMFYLFHMFHTATHFQLGGCWIRPILDTWFLNHIIEFNQEKRGGGTSATGWTLTICRNDGKSGGGMVFRNGSSRNYRHRKLCYNGGLYGRKQKITAAQAQNSSRLECRIMRDFPPIKTMKFVGYPIVEKWKVLLPFCWIHRLIRGFIQGKGELVPYELQKM